MAFSTSHKRLCQRHRSHSPEVTNRPPASLLGTCSSPTSTQLGNFSKVFTFLDSHEFIEQPISKHALEQLKTICQSTSSNPGPVFVPPVNLILSERSPNITMATAGNTNCMTFSATSTASATSSHSSSLVASDGESDPLELDQTGGAALSDITTPPTTPTSNTITSPASIDEFFSAGERIFNSKIAKRTHHSVEKSHSDRLIDDFGNHDQQLQVNFPEHYDTGVHVFVDASNATIGLYNCLKEKFGLQKNQPLPACFLWSGLQQVVERTRKISGRYVAGSKNPFKDSPKFLKDAEDGRYTSLILDRVPLEANRGVSSSDSDDAKSVTRYREQGVDETLQHRMCMVTMDSAISGSPGVMVLITGDGNNNEYGHSDGFPAHVERALQFGWVVEVYSFRQGSSDTWTNPEFLNNNLWAGRLSHHYLDDYAFDLCDPAYKKELTILAHQYATRISPRHKRSKMNNSFNNNENNKPCSKLLTTFSKDLNSRTVDSLKAAPTQRIWTPVKTHGAKVQRCSYVAPICQLQHDWRMPSPKKAANLKSLGPSSHM